MAKKTPVTIYGLSNCSTVAKARAWLDAHGVANRFHDHREDGVDKARLRGWARALGWEKLMNRASYTFRGLPDADKADLDEAKAVELMMAHPALIKRPLLDLDGALILGFRSTKHYEAALL